MEILRKYGEATSIRFPLITYSGTDYRTASTPFVSGEVEISKDGGSFIACENLPTSLSNGVFELDISPQEMECSGAIITVISGSGVKLWEDQSFLINTFGHSSAQYQFDFDSATTPSPAVYYADITLLKDGNQSRDEYTVSWFKDDAPYNADNTSLRVVSRETGSVLFEEDMNSIDNTNAYSLNATGESGTSFGESYIMTASGILDDEYQTWQKIIPVK